MPFTPYALRVLAVVSAALSVVDYHNVGCFAAQVTLAVLLWLYAAEFKPRPPV